MSHHWSKDIINCQMKSLCRNFHKVGQYMFWNCNDSSLKFPQIKFLATPPLTALTYTLAHCVHVVKSFNYPCNYSTTLCLKKVPTFILSVTLSNLNRFPHFLHWWKTYEICYKAHTTLPTHLRRVATLPWEIKNSNCWLLINTTVTSAVTNFRW